jgi:hypothetical protein
MMEQLADTTRGMLEETAAKITFWFYCETSL